MKVFIGLLLVALARANPINPILKDHGDHIVPQDPINPTIPLVNSAEVIVPDVLVDSVVPVAPISPVIAPGVEYVAPVAPVIVTEPVVASAVAPIVVEPIAPVAEALLNSVEPKVIEPILPVAPVLVDKVIAPIVDKVIIEETVRSVVEPSIEEKIVSPIISEPIIEPYVAPKEPEIIAPTFNSVSEVPLVAPVVAPVSPIVEVPLVSPVLPHVEVPSAVPVVAPIIAPIESKEEDFEHAKKLVIEVVSELKQYLPNDEVEPAIVAPVSPIVYSSIDAIVPSVDTVVPLAPVLVSAPEVKVPVVPSVEVAPLVPASPIVPSISPVEAIDIKVISSEVAPSVVESIGTQRQQNQMSGLIDQVNRLSETIENNITDLVSRRRYVQAAVLRSLLSYVRRVRVNLERLQNRLQSVADITQQSPQNPNAPARPAIPGTEFINSIRDRLNRIQEEVVAVMSRIRTTFVPGGSSTPAPFSATQSAPVANSVAQASIASAVGTILGAGSGIPNVVNAQVTSV